MKEWYVFEQNISPGKKRTKLLNPHHDDMIVLTDILEKYAGPYHVAILVETHDEALDLANQIGIYVGEYDEDGDFVMNPDYQGSDWDYYIRPNKADLDEYCRIVGWIPYVW